MQSVGPTKLRVLIVDDQALGREHLRRLLAHEPAVDIMGQCSSGREALTAIRAHSPDVVFLDIQMPDLDGFEVLSQLEPERMPSIIFVTANDDFAVRAFEFPALDFLVKPCSVERLRIALARARTQREHQRSRELIGHLTALLHDLRSPRAAPQRLAIKTGNRVLLLKVKDITWIEAADNYLKLHLGAETYMVRDTLQAFETRLPADQFLRINRSAIVNIERIRELQPLFHGDYAVILRDGTQLNLSRNYRDKLTKLGVA